MTVHPSTRIHGNAPRRLPFWLPSVGLFSLSLALSLQAGTPGPTSPEVALGDYARVIHVDGATGSDITGDGSTAKPLASITGAIEEAGAPTVEKRVAILVSQGIYTQPTFVLKAHVELFGGYASPGGKRDVMATPSVLDGEDRRRIVRICNLH